MRTPWLPFLALLIGLQPTALLAQSPESKQLNQEGIELAQAQNYEAAADKFLAAIQADPSNPDPHANLGLVYFHQDRFEQAIESAEQAIQLDPNHCQAYYNRGIAQEKRNNLYGAIESYAAVMDCDPTKPEAWEGRGYIRGFDLGISSSQGAVDDLRKARELYQDRGDTQSVNQMTEWITEICTTSEYTLEGCP